MKKSSISRRDFMRGLTTGAISVAMVPSWAEEIKQVSDFSALNPGSPQLMRSLPPFFDCNKYLGPGFPQNPDFPAAADLLAHLDRLGIDRAVAWHTDALGHQPMSGNEKLIREIETSGASGRIIPSFIISPSLINDPGTMDSFLDLVKTHHIRAFHFFPKKSGTALSDLAPVIRKILQFNPVLFLDAFESLGTDLADIMNFSQEFQKLTIIFTNAMWAHYDKLYELMEARSNIFVDTSFLHTYRTIENIINRFGVERLIFGAGYKSNNGASIASLANSEISPEHSRLIAHGNLEKLLEIKSPLIGDRAITGNRLWHKLLRREPLGPEIIDAHTHHTRTIMKWVDHDETDFDSQVKQSLKYMDEMGVSFMIIAEYEPDLPESPRGMTYLEEHIKPYGDRFHGYFCAQVFKSETKEKLIPLLDKLFSRSYYVGFKMHNDHWGIPVTDPCFIPMWEYANSHHLPILLHTWNSKYNAPKMLKDIVSKYPDAIFILGHSGNTDRPDAELLATEYPNVYLEWCGSFVNPADWRTTIEHIGNKRILYGSDGVSWETRWGHSPAWEMGRLLSLGIPDETILPILGGNMISILAKRR